MSEIRPRESLICITDRCPLDCLHCFVAKKDIEMSLETIYEIIPKLKELGVKDIVLLGGEPTSHSQFGSVVEAFQSNFKNLTVESNGVLKTNFYDYPKCNVAVSFEYPDKEKNDSIRRFKKGKKSVFELALRKIRTLHNPKIIRWCLRQDLNVFKCLVMADMYGCNSVFFPLIPQGSAVSQKGFPDAHKIAETLQLIREFNKKSKFHHELALPQTYLYNKELYLKHSETFLCRSRICQAGIGRIYLGVDASLYPCPFVPIKIGNILTDEVTFIKDKLLEFNNKMRAKKSGFPCSNCFLSPICGNGCLAYHFDKKTKQQENCPVNFLINNYKEVI